MSEPMTSPNPAARVVPSIPLSNDEAVAFLTVCADYFERRPTDGEDAAHWSNVSNGRMCRKIAAMLSAAKPPADAVAELDAFYQGWLARWRDRLASLSPAATSGSEAGGEAWPSQSGGLNADWVAMVLAEDARIEDGKLANGPYLAVKIAEAADMPSEVSRLRKALGHIRDHTRETSTATMALGALAKPASSPAGDVREAVARAIWKFERAPENGMTEAQQDFDWRLMRGHYEECADLVLAALSPSTSAAEPVAPMHGPYRVKWLGAGVWAGINEELPAELEGKDVWLTTAPPAPAAVDGQRVKARRDDPFRPAVDVDADDDYYPSREED